MTPSRIWVWLALVPALLTAVLPAGAQSVPPKRIAFIVESWYPWSHADVIGTRFLEGYRVGDKVYSSPLTVASVYTDAPQPNDKTRALATRYGFRIATSVAEALLDDARSPRPRLAVDGVLIATREDLPKFGGQLASPTPRLRVVREVLRILDQTGTRVPIFVDKMPAANWGDSQTIVAEAARLGVPLMAGSVLPYTPLDRPVRGGGVEVGIVIVSAPYWAFAFHAAELLQGFMEQRTTREVGVSTIREVGRAYWSMPDRDRWGGRVFDALLASARTKIARAVAVPAGLGPETYVLLIQYVDGTRAVLALVPRVFDDTEFLLGAQHADGSMSTGGLLLQGEPFDHFGYLVHALAAFFTTGHPTVPVERALLTTGIVLLGQEARQAGGPVSSPSLAISYPVTRGRP